MCVREIVIIEGNEQQLTIPGILVERLPDQPILELIVQPLVLKIYTFNLFSFNKIY
jgi:hypothetical protein